MSSQDFVGSWIVTIDIANFCTDVRDSKANFFWIFLPSKTNVTVQNFCWCVSFAIIRVSLSCRLWAISITEVFVNNNNRILAFLDESKVECWPHVICRTSTVIISRSEKLESFFKKSEWTFVLFEKLNFRKIACLLRNHIPGHSWTISNPYHISDYLRYLLIWKSRGSLTV